MKLNINDKVAIVACSDGLDISQRDVVDELVNILKSFGLKVVLSDYIYKKESVFSGTAEEKATALMSFYKDEEIKAIFDISGGNLANSVLEYLDYDIIRKASKPFVGYSDLTVILNSLYTKCNIKSYLYQVRNLVGPFKDIQCKEFRETFMEDKDSLLNYDYEWIQGDSIEGVVVGGNIRCLLKLSGTEFMPDFTDKILFIESFSGGVSEMTTFLTQYKLQGVFKKVKGIILGHYTVMQREEYSPNIIELVKTIIKNPDMPIIKTDCIGHAKDSKCLVVGEKITLKRKI